MKYWLLSIASSLTLLAMTSLYAQDAVLPSDKDTPQAPDFASPVDPPTYVQIPKPATPSPPSQPRVDQP
ncbi:MAG: hypothetical protein Q8P84_08400, partial [Deltaproteobacteria bacterium]|nr:hypothetical protein [Deltaproteobacteria bacterium]